MIRSVHKEYIFDENAPTKSCHASTVLPLPDGDVLAAWFGGTAEGKDDVDIFVSRKDKTGWTTPLRITADKALPHWNPVLFGQKDGTVLLYFKVGKKIPYWKTFFVSSSDAGHTWSAPKELVPGDNSGGRGPVKNKPIYLSDGSVLAPASTEQSKWLAFTDRSFDGGYTFEKQALIPARKIAPGTPVPLIQPTLWESAPGKVHAILRSSRGHAYRADSEDYGATWCRAYPTAIKNPNSGLDLTKATDGRLFLVYNPCGKNWGDRAPLKVAVSEDNGQTFRDIYTLEKRTSHDDEFSYPAIVFRNNRLYITYTWQRQKIAYAEIELS